MSSRGIRGRHRDAQESIISQQLPSHLLFSNPLLQPGALRFSPSFHRTHFLISELISHFIPFKMYFSQQIILVAALAASASAHGVVTKITGANGVVMPGLTVQDGTPRDCSSK
jgi:hypothetical protein